MIRDSKPRLKLGITGGIGSGKTSVCKVFEILGVPVFSADRDASEVVENDQRIKKGINSVAGKNLYTNGALDRMELATIIFNDKTLLEKINSLVHPVVFDHFLKWTLKQTTQYVIMEAAILFESGAAKYVDKVATVVAPLEQRVERIIQRNKLSKEQIMERIKNQIDDEIRMKLSDYVIYNSENDMIIPAILKIHDEILTLINAQI